MYNEKRLKGVIKQLNQFYKQTWKNNKLIFIQEVENKIHSLDFKLNKRLNIEEVPF